VIVRRRRVSGRDAEGPSRRSGGRGARSRAYYGRQNRRLSASASMRAR
jgi:hypothetical protein